MIDYLEEDITSLPTEPKIWDFKFTSYFWWEKYLAFKCAGPPYIWLRTGDVKNNNTNIIWIVLLQEEDLERGAKKTTEGEDEDDDLIREILG